MSVDADYLVDRRRLKRRLVFWRIAAVVAIVVAVIVAVGRFQGSAVGGHVGRLTVDGIILEDPDRLDALADLAADDSVKALIVRIDSPGGTVVGGETLYRHLRLVGQSKPVVTVFGGLGTSAAYMAALGSDYIVAREGTITGSIGVILQTTDLTGMLDKIGIKPEAVKSTPLKAQPNPLEPFTPAARAAIQQVIGDLYVMFVNLVDERRELTRDQLAWATDGRVFSGRQALENGLVDAVGGEPEAREWLERAHAIDADTPIENIEIEKAEEWVRRLVGERIGKVLFSERLSLDGLVSLWHPDL
jgi:protease-4